MSGRRLLGNIVLLACVLLLVVAGLWAWGLVRNDRPTYAVDTPLDEQCEEVPGDAQRLVLEADDGFQLGAATVGAAGRRGLVLRQGAGQTICEWLPLAGRIAEETGVRVLLFDRRGRGSSPGDGDLTAEPGDIAAAVDRLRSQGVRRVGLMASSMGNSVTFAALEELERPTCVLVSVSPVLVSSDGNGQVDGSGLVDLPANVWVVTETGNTSVAAYADAVVEASGTDHHLEIDTDSHSFGLVRDHPEAADFVVEAVASCR